MTVAYYWSEFGFGFARKLGAGFGSYYYLLHREATMSSLTIEGLREELNAFAELTLHLELHAVKDGTC